ncbi:MAG: orotidine-5'-phosphate decarboxylase [Burkholderiales bacterium]|nr:orotidine-5'-phosphate decarboxylase [Burkholderiales bacterium]
MTAFTTLLRDSWRRNDSLLCVGLDPDVKRIPEHLGRGPAAIGAFCRAIVDATADLVCAFKPQIAYFHAERAEAELEELIAHIHARHPGVPVILDAKRGDIGSTAEQYAREAFERYQADAVTVSPFLGRDSIIPYTSYRERGVIVLCRTSNPGGSDMQFLEVDGPAGRELIYQRIARVVAQDWNSNGNCALVVGATFPRELKDVRAIVGDLPLLVPGIGAQGGDIEATVRAGQSADGTGLIINSGRAILYASGGTDFAAAARAAAQATRDEINRFRT